MMLGSNGCLLELTELAQKLSPHVNWPSVPIDFQLHESTADAGHEPINQTNFYSDAVGGDKCSGDKVMGDKIKHHHSYLPRRGKKPYNLHSSQMSYIVKISLQMSVQGILMVC